MEELLKFLEKTLYFIWLRTMRVSRESDRSDSTWYLTENFI